MATGNQSFADAAAFTVVKRPIPRTGELLAAIGLGTYQSFDAGNSASEPAVVVVSFADCKAVRPREKVTVQAKPRPRRL